VGSFARHEGEPTVQAPWASCEIMRYDGYAVHMVIAPWNHWYHCMGNTFGTWLPGSPKGFRTRHHREHVEGDYKHPPPKGM
jgi:hypothetical protein